MDISLYHDHYDAQHLTEVKAQMQTLGTPQIRAIRDDVHGLWLAVEGCHRLRAAQELGLTPNIIDISDDEKVTIQDDGDDVEVSVSELTAELISTAHRRQYLSFGD